MGAFDEMRAALSRKFNRDFELIALRGVAGEVSELMFILEREYRADENCASEVADAIEKLEASMAEWKKVVG